LGISRACASQREPRSLRDLDLYVLGDQEAFPQPCLLDNQGFLSLCLRDTIPTRSGQRA
jgi:hypothetical protein